MSPSGGVDPLYVLARRVLLDALEALGPQRGAVILVGAQAVYLHTGPAGIAVAPYTTDADIALNPDLLADSPQLGEMLQGAGFRPDARQVGTWLVTRALQGQDIDVVVDLLVPAAVGGDGRRGARLGPHGNRAARKAKGLEAVLVDNRKLTVRSLESADTRAYEIAAAGPAALLVAKLHKIDERKGEPGRLQDKDALDVLRLLRSTGAQELAASFQRLFAARISEAVSREAVNLLKKHFSRPDSTGSMMAARAAEPLENPDTTAASCAALAGELLEVLAQIPAANPQA